MKKNLFKLIRSPYLTEKVTQLMQASNQYAFKVDINSNKSDIKKAIESYFSVEVKNVTVIKVKGKLKRSKFRTKKKPDWKKDTCGDF